VFPKWWSNVPASDCFFFFFFKALLPTSLSAWGPRRFWSISFPNPRPDAVGICLTQNRIPASASACPPIRAPAYLRYRPLHSAPQIHDGGLVPLGTHHTPTISYFSTPRRHPPTPVHLAPTNDNFESPVFTSVRKNPLQCLSASSEKATHVTHFFISCLSLYSFFQNGAWANL